MLSSNREKQLNSKERAHTAHLKCRPVWRPLQLTEVGAALLHVSKAWHMQAGIEHLAGAFLSVCNGLLQALKGGSAPAQPS